MTATRKAHDVEKGRSRRIAGSTSRMPENSLFYEKLVPALLIVLSIIMVLLILFAVAVLLGLVPLA